MGEVYKARDARLDRDVAVKVLLPEVSSDPDRLRRFEREARAAAALNHPNILSVFDVGTHDGTVYVVTELLEGETLRARLDAGPLPIRRTIDYAVQIARGMVAAHRKGITHRDLKPENLLVTRSGVVKILDFGLAKLTAPPNLLSGPSGVTAPGMVLGTAGYMSPEQARGELADHRSDIFSFGVVLYEMLAGRRPFQGDTVLDTLSATLKEEPPDLGQLVPGLSPGIKRIVERCLEKNLDDRFQSAADLGFALEPASELSGSPILQPHAKRLSWKAVAALGVLLAAMAAAFVAGARFLSRGPAEFRQLTFRRGTVQAARFAPDGDTIVYAAAWEGNPAELFTTRPEAPEARSLQMTSTGLFALSSNGEMAVVLKPSGFGLVSGTLGRAALAGGVPRQLLQSAVAADWSPDGTGLAVVQAAGGRSVLQYPIGQTLYDPSPSNISHIRFSPSGDAIALITHPVFGETAGSVMLVDLEGQARTLSEGWNSVLGVGWSPDGREIWFTGTRSGASQALYAVTRSGDERLLLRAPAALTLHDVSSDGRALVTRDAWGAGVMAHGPGSTGERDLSWLDGTMAWDLSTDGTTAILEESWEGGGSARSIYLRTMDGAPAVRLGDGVPLALSPDKQWVVSTPAAGTELNLVPTSTGQHRVLPRGPVTSFFPAARWLPDGRSILFSGTEPGRRTRVYLQSIESGEPRAITPEGVFGRIAIMPDGKAFVTRGTDRRLAIVTIDGADVRPLAGAEPGDLPIVSSADGRWLYVQTGSDLPAEIARIDVHSGDREVVRTLRPPDPSGVTSILRTVMTPDGGSYAYTYIRAVSALFLVEGLR